MAGGRNFVRKIAHRSHEPTRVVAQAGGPAGFVGVPPPVPDPGTGTVADPGRRGGCATLRVLEPKEAGAGTTACASLDLRALPLHPAVQDRFLEFPAIAAFEAGDPFRVNVLIKSLTGYAQVFGRLPDTHNFSGLSHAADLPQSSDACIQI